MIGIFARDVRRSFSFADVSPFFTTGVCMMGTPNSLSSERADASESLPLGWSTSYLGILPLPLFDLERGRDVLSSGEGSCGPLSCAELGLSFGRGLGRISTFEMEFYFSFIGLDGVESISYHDIDSSKTTSRLTRTARVEGLKNLYAFLWDDYPTRIHFSDFASNFSRLVNVLNCGVKQQNQKVTYIHYYILWIRRVVIDLRIHILIVLLP